MAMAASRRGFSLFMTCSSVLGGDDGWTVCPFVAAHAASPVPVEDKAFRWAINLLDIGRAAGRLGAGGFLPPAAEEVDEIGDGS